MKISYGTDVGVVRNDNQDSVFTKIFSNKLGVFIVADGMGGHLAGEVASTMAVESLKESFENLEINFSDLAFVSVAF